MNICCCTGFWVGLKHYITGHEKLFCPVFCSELMMRDNLFEVVTTSRTFYVQVLLSHFIVDSLFPSLNVKDSPYYELCSSNTTYFLSIQAQLYYQGTIKQSKVTYLHSVLSLCVRLTVQRTCTAGLKPSQGRS